MDPSKAFSDWKRTRWKPLYLLLTTFLILIIFPTASASEAAANCFQDTPDAAWAAVFRHNATAARLNIVPTAAGPDVATCLQEQSASELKYAFDVMRSTDELVYEKEWESIVAAPSELLPRSYTNDTLEEEDVKALSFGFLVLPGKIRLQNVNLRKSRSAHRSKRTTTHPAAGS